MVIPELISLLSGKIIDAFQLASCSSPSALDSGEESESDLDVWPEDSFGDGIAGHQRTSIPKSSIVAAKLRRRIASDLGTVRSAGFKIGILTGMKPDSVTSILSVSVQVSRLGLSTEVLSAWDLKCDHYVVLLIRYNNGYMTFDDVIEMGARAIPIEFRIGTYRGRSEYPYKPTLREALAAFTVTNDKCRAGDEAQGSVGESGLQALFVSSSLNEFLNKQFLSLVKTRHARGLDWDTANAFLNGQGDEIILQKNIRPEDSNIPHRTLPEFLSADHLAPADLASRSFPLVAMQFALRFLVRCTEFCLVCHARTEETFEAMKPYVCSNPLCLYQYMSLGFGPSIEHEILIQPYVVDLLISFCYASSKAHRFREFPAGLGLCVPGQVDPPTCLQAFGRYGPSTTPAKNVASKSELASFTTQRKPASIQLERK